MSAGPSTQDKQFSKRNNTVSKRNVRVMEPGLAYGTESAAAATRKPSASTSKSGKDAPPVDGVTDQDSALKSDSGLRSWNRLADKPQKALLSDPDVRRWHDNLRRSSALTCSVRLGRLNLFCDTNSRQRHTDQPLSGMSCDRSVTCVHGLLLSFGTPVTAGRT